MKKIKILVALLLVTFVAANAQKYAFVDSDYILNNIPSYKTALEDLDKQAETWQSEVEAMFGEIEKMYNEYQAEKVLLTAEMQKKREEAIIAKERQAKKLQNEYFGQDGLLYKRREEKIGPIQDEIYNAIKEIANEDGYATIFDTASGPTILYSNPRYDISDDVLRRLGYKN